MIMNALPNGTFLRFESQKVICKKNMSAKPSVNQSDIEYMLLKPLICLDNWKPEYIFELTNRSVTYVKRYCPH
jgi:hypothetical protein